MSSGVYAQIKSTPMPDVLQDGSSSRILDRTMPVAGLTGKKKVAFIQQAYAHFLAALAAFALLELLSFELGLAAAVSEWTSAAGWFGMLSAFLAVAWMASRVAHRVTGLRAQYFALALFVVVEALIFMPLLYAANTKSPEILHDAILAAVLALTGLAAVVFISGKDFSFLKGMIYWTALMAVVTVAGGLIGFHSATYLTVSVIGLAGAAILHDTSRILHRFSKDRYVAAGLELFASVGLLFWHVLRLFLSRDRD